MNAAVWKVPLLVTGRQTVALPAGARILTVQTQGVPYLSEQLCLWAVVDTGATLTTRTIEVFGTGHPIEEAEREYIGTAQMNDGGLVWHVFERL